MTENLVEGEKSLSKPITKLNIKTSSEKKKPRKQIITVLKENKPAFSVIATKATDLLEVLSTLSHHCH